LEIIKLKLDCFFFKIERNWTVFKIERNWTHLQLKQRKGLALQKVKNKMGKKCNLEKRKVKQLKITKRTKTDKLPKMRYFKIPLCQKIV